MKKILGLLGASCLSITASSNVVSCFDTTPKIDYTFADQFEIFELGDISGEEDLPTLETIYDAVNEVHSHLDLWKLVVDFERIEFADTPTKESCKLKVIDKWAAPFYTGEVTFTYKYQKILEPEISYDLLFEQRKIKKRTGSLDEISKFSNLVSNWKWIANLESASQLAYTDLKSYGASNGQGLCEYISLNMLINYSQIFGKHNLYSTYDKNKYFYQLNSKDVKHNEFDSGNKKAIPYLMYDKIRSDDGGRWTDIREGKSMRKIMKKWLGDYSNNLIDDYSVSWSHTSKPETWIKKYNRPVLLSFFAKGEAHSIVIYGFNSSTKEYAVNYGWPNRGNGLQIIKKSEIWSYFSMGFWYGLRDK
ncbi:putative cysteine peptidase [Spiroplasma endosymbiont of Cantharis rufa]|uniref:putative cysteine peptidase n=1 Tax=Spiroplasma endosymbiont of Cantharis rufa TaxID=3066279 RepID=UPI0030CE0601